MNPLDKVRAALAELRAKRDALDAELGTIEERAAADGRVFLNDDETIRATAIRSEASTLAADISAHEEREAELVEHAARTEALAARQSAGTFQFIRPQDPANVSDVRTMNVTQLTDVVKRGAETRDIEADHAVRIMRRHAKNTDWLRSTAARATDAYESAFHKLIRNQPWDLTAEERAALSATTGANGGYLVPTHLDPTIILTNTGSANIMRQLGRVVTQTVGNVWHGVSSAGVSAGFAAPLTEASDNSPTFSNPSVTLHRAQAFVQATIEAMVNIDNLPSDVLGMFGDARDRLEGAKHMSGSGTDEPYGIFTAITGSQAVLSGTAATITLIDLLAVKTSLGQRWRNKSSWIFNPTYGDAIRQLGSALGASYSVNLAEGNSEKVVGRPVYETDDAPTTQTTTVKDPELILGDHSNYVIADKPASMEVIYVPVMFNTATNLPDGRVGWYAYWFTGADSVNDAAFRVLLDKTSA